MSPYHMKERGRRGRESERWIGGEGKGDGIEVKCLNECKRKVNKCFDIWFHNHNGFNLVTF